MRSPNLAVAAISTALSLVAHAAEPPFTGRFLGSGRACYGMLAVDARSVSWLTAFSQCQAVPVELVERDTTGGALRVTYRFKTAPASCRFGALSLSHDGTKNLNTGWQVVGYASEARFIEDKMSGYTMNAPDMMSCALIREPHEHAKNQRMPSHPTLPRSEKQTNSP